MYNFAMQQTKDPYNFDIGKTTPYGKQPAKTSATAKTNSNNNKKNAEPKETKAQKLKSMIPKRIALKYDPPTIILEYLQQSTGKLYHHKMKLLKLRDDTPDKHALDYLKKKHAMYFMNNRLNEKQLLELISKLKSRLAAAKPVKGGTSNNTSVPVKPTSAKQRPQTASTVASSKLTKELDDYGMNDEDMYSYEVSKNKMMKQQPILDDEEEYEEDYEEDDEQVEEQYNMIYNQMKQNKDWNMAEDDEEEYDIV